MMAAHQSQETLLLPDSSTSGTVNSSINTLTRITLYQNIVPSHFSSDALSFQNDLREDRGVARPTAQYGVMCLAARISRASINHAMGKAGLRLEVNYRDNTQGHGIID
jgi:hypothetical protein